jgi:hypothetical protein
VLTEEKIDAIAAKLEHKPQKSLRCHAQDIGISKSAAIVMKLLKLWPYKLTVVHSLQPCDPDSRFNLCNWLLQ